MLKGFKNFLMQGDLIVIAVGLVRCPRVQHPHQGIHRQHHHAPLVAAAGGSSSTGLGWTLNGQRINLAGLHFGHRLLRHLHRRDLFRLGSAVPGVHEEARNYRLRPTPAHQDLSGLLVRGSSRGNEVHVLH